MILKSFEDRLEVLEQEDSDPCTRRLIRAPKDGDTSKRFSRGLTFAVEDPVQWEPLDAYVTSSHVTFNETRVFVQRVYGGTYSDISLSGELWGEKVQRSFALWLAYTGGQKSDFAHVYADLRKLFFRFMAVRHNINVRFDSGFSLVTDSWDYIIVSQIRLYKALEVDMDYETDLPWITSKFHEVRRSCSVYTEKDRHVLNSLELRRLGDGNGLEMVLAIPPKFMDAAVKDFCANGYPVRMGEGK